MPKSSKPLLEFLLYLLVYPIISIFINPLIFLQTIFNNRVLFTGKLKDFNTFSPYEGLNHFFYKTRALNLKKYGRNGKSPYLALGDFKLNRMFHYTLPSLYAHYKSSNLVTLFSLIVFISSYCILPTLSSFAFKVIIILIFLFSSSWFFQMKNQNYNVLGWMLFPFLLFAIQEGQLYYIAIIVFAISFFSFTAWVVSCLVLAFYILFYQWWLLIILLLPSVLNIALLFIPIIKDPEGGAVLQKVAKAVGLNSTKAKYVRKYKATVEWKITRIYELGLYCIYALCLIYLSGSLPVYILLFIGLYVMNHFLVRFMDNQSLNILFVSSIIASALESGNYYILPIAWLAINPLPIAHNLKSKNPLFINALKPFNVRRIYSDLEAFLKPIKTKSKVLLSYSDPGTSYDRVFDGYRNLIELPHFIANHNEIHLLPDWWSVFEVNYEGAPDFWGRSPTEVFAKMDEWKTDYAIIYKAQNEVLSVENWEEKFNFLASFDWDKYQELKSDIRLCKAGFPKWYLIEKK